MGVILCGFVGLFAILGAPLALLARTTANEASAAPATKPGQRAGLVLVLLCIAFPAFVALLRFAIS